MSTNFYGWYSTSKDTVMKTWTSVAQACESQRLYVVNAAKNHLSVESATIVERVSRAVPEAFCALSSLFGILTTPACLVSVGRKFTSLLPLIKTTIRFDFHSEAFKKASGETLNNLKGVFEEVLVPALLVYFVTSSVLALGGGLLTLNFSKLLYASAVGIPAAWMTLEHMRKAPVVPTVPSV